jgi:shikimate kinase
MNRRGVTVFLDPPISVLVERLETDRAHRPLLQSTNDLAYFIIEKLTSRRHHYEKAQIQVVLSNPNAEVERLLIRLLGSF